jgi:molybdopterin-guanine dinucleotide biosynthesis protein
MHADKPFKIISVTGAHSGVGKTTLCAILLKNLRHFGAIKYTKSEFYTSLTDNADIIMEKNKDTAILSESGAERVVWIQSPKDGLGNALDIALGKMNGLQGVVVEGNSPSGCLSPDLIMFVLGKDGDIKESAAGVMESANVIVYNAEEDVTPPPSVYEMTLNDARIFRIDLLRQSGEIDKCITHVKKYIDV